MELVIGAVVGLVDIVTAPIPFLAESGLLLVLFAVMWAVLGLAIVRAPAKVASAWTRLRALPIPAQVAIWVVFLPVVAGVAVWQLAWPRLARLGVVAGIAAWNLLVFLPAG